MVQGGQGIDGEFHTVLCGTIKDEDHYLKLIHHEGNRTLEQYLSSLSICASC